MFKINVGVSFQPPGKPNEYHGPGETAALDGWPAEDLERFLREGIIEKVDVAPAVDAASEPEPVFRRKVLPAYQPKDGE